MSVIYNDDETKKIYENNEITYLFSVKNYYYKFTKEKINCELHIFKMKKEFKDYYSYIKYDDRFFILSFNEDDEVYLLLLNNKIIYMGNYSENSYREMSYLNNYIIDLTKIMV